MEEVQKCAGHKQDIDIFLIAGQSNGVGHSTFDEEIIKRDYPQFLSGFDHVLYTGNSRGTDEAEGQYFARQREISITNTRIGLGRTELHFGCEVGAAQILATRYNEKSGKYAGFIKYAAGGTSLLNDLTGENAPEGNWVSPSYAAKLADSQKKTGGLYRNLLAEVRKGIQTYQEYGFIPHLKGLYWMQGENDRENPAEYIKAFTCFVNDLRNDLGKITGENLQKFPIFVGEISETFMSSKDVAINKKFIAAQNELPKFISNVVILHSSTYQMNDGERVLGTDNCHWGMKDMISIGNDLGKAFLMNIL